MGQRGRRAARLGPAALQLQAVQQGIRRTSQRQQLARGLLRPRAGRGGYRGRVPAVRPDQRLLPAAQRTAGPGPVPGDLPYYHVVHRDRAQRCLYVSPGVVPGGVAARTGRPGQEPAMRVLLVHNRYRSATPSGENRVVDSEGEELAKAGHEIRRFGKDSDEIEHWSAAKKALLPARVVWSRESHRELAATLRDYRPDVVHVHNTFPLLSGAVLYACRDASVPIVTTLHNYRLVCAPGDLLRNGTVCHDCTHRLPLPGVVHGCYRGSRAATAPLVAANIAHRKAWRSLVAAYVFISAAQRDLHLGLNLPASRVFVRHNMVSYRDTKPVPREPMVAYIGRLDETKGLRLLMSGW